MAAVAAEVWLWGKRVGAVAEDDAGRVVYQYDADFVRDGWEISPIHLARAVVGDAPISFPELTRVEAFAGLPGVLADSLPDRFGNAIIRKYFTDRGRADAALSPVQRLLYVGARALGALEFRPAVRRPVAQSELLPLELSDLVAQARSVLSGETDIVIPEIMRVGASAGGARAKAVLLWDRTANTLRSEFAPPKPGEEHWIAKFDGVGETGAPDDTPKPFNRVEFVYTELAKRAGIDTAHTLLLQERGYAHLMSRRFDRVNGARLHLHSLGGLQHVDFNSPGAYSYEGLIRTILTLGIDYPAIEEAFRRAVFNVALANQDDHVKNTSFLLHPTEGWSLAPAYDLTFAKGAGFTRHHQMSLSGKTSAITRDDLIAFGKFSGLRKNGADIIDRVLEVREEWPALAAEAGVDEKVIARIKKELPPLVLQ